MKLLVAFNLTDLEKALRVGSTIETYADMFTIGPLLLYKYGEVAVQQFREAFPKMPLLVEAQVLERPQETVTLFAKAGAQWISVMAGASSHTIYNACTAAHDLGAKIIIDLADASSIGQTALEAKRLGADALSFHKPSIDDDNIPFIDRWQMVKGNTSLPIFISAHISRENIADILSLEPSGIIIGTSVINAHYPEEEIKYFTTLIKNKRGSTRQEKKNT